MKLAWCKSCKPPRLIAAGGFPDKPLPSHRVGIEVHDKVVVVKAADTPKSPGEKMGAYFTRLEKTFQKLAPK